MNLVSFFSLLRRLMSVLVLAAFTLTETRCARATDPPAQRSINSITIADTQRTYILRLPSGYDGKTKLPLVMLLHGANDTAEYAEEAYRFVEKSEAEKFILVLPESLPPRAAWDAFSNKPDADLDFLSRLLTELPKSYAIDTRRVYVAGHSSGACMTYRLAAERGDLIAAMGIVAGSVGSPSLPEPKVPVPLIVFHGKEDPTIPYGEMAGAIQFWAGANGCGEKPDASEAIGPAVMRDTYRSKKSAEIVAYTVADGNHMWPGGKAMPGKDQVPVQEISATDLMWDFFKRHGKRP